MDNQPATAALQFPEQDSRLYGTVTRMSAQDISVRLDVAPHSYERFAAGTGAGLIVLARDMMYSTATEVVEATGGDVRLLFTSVVTATQRRRHLRVAFELGVSFRLVQDDGCFGSWRSGVSKDISAGGMGLIVAAGFEAPRYVEVLFMLPDPNFEPLPAGAMGMNTHVEMLQLVPTDRSTTQRTPNKERPIKASARVCNHRPLPNGQIALGIAFTAVSPNDQVRLTRFLNAPWHTIV